MRLPMNAGAGMASLIEDAIPNIIANTPHIQPWSTISGKPSRFMPMAHTHLATDIVSLTWSQITGAPTTFPPDVHTQDWSTVTGKPSSYTPSAHSHEFGGRTSRTLAVNTAYQATTPARSASFVITLDSTASLTLTVGQTHSADLVVGSTSGVASGTGTVVSSYANSNTGVLVIGLGTNTRYKGSLTLFLAPNEYFAIRVTSGTVSISSAFEQALT